MYYCLCSCSALVVKTVLRLLLHYTNFSTCNLYNNILVKSTNQFLQCRYIYIYTTVGLINTPVDVFAQYGYAQWIRVCVCQAYIRRKVK